MQHSIFTSILTSAVLLAPLAMAQDVRITTFKADSTFSLNGREFTIARDQNTAATLQGDFTLTSRACPPHCIQPMSAGDGVATSGELEVLAFLEDTVSNGEGLLLDTRLPADFNQRSIPGAINVPHITLNTENRFRDDILRALGATGDTTLGLDFSNAMSLMVFSGGVWSSDAADAVEHLLNAGYPAEKIYYYRGGLQAWAHVGLPVIVPQNPG